MAATPATPAMLAKYLEAAPVGEELGAEVEAVLALALRPLVSLEGAEVVVPADDDDEEPVDEVVNGVRDEGAELELELPEDEADEDEADEADPDPPPFKHELSELACTSTWEE